MLGDCGTSLGAFRACIVLIVGIFLQALVEGMTYFRAADTDEINSLDSLIDSFAIEDATFELLDANTQEFLVLTLDFTSTSFILGKVGIFIADFCRVGESDIQI